MYPFVGPTFECITSSGNFKLGDIKATGMKDSDYLYILNTENGTPDNSTKIVYIDAATAASKWGEDYDEDEYLEWVGWWKAPAPDYPDESSKTLIDDTTYVSGTAFLANFSGRSEVSFTYSGAAQGSIVNVTADKKPYPMFCNPIPRDVALKDVTVTGMKDSEYIYKLNKNNGTPDNTTKLVYIDAATAKAKWSEDYDEDEYSEWIGWWVAPAPDYPDESSKRVLNLDTDVWGAGESYIGNFNGKNTIVISFPKAY